MTRDKRSETIFSISLSLSFRQLALFVRSCSSLSIIRACASERLGSVVFLGRARVSRRVKCVRIDGLGGRGGGGGYTGSGSERD